MLIFSGVCELVEELWHKPSRPQHLLPAEQRRSAEFPKILSIKLKAGREIIAYLSMNKKKLDWGWWIIHFGEDRTIFILLMEEIRLTSW